MGQRIEHIDSIRAVAVLLMVMVHAAATWGPSPSSQPSSLVYVVSGLGGLAAPLFVTIYGWGCFHSSATLNQRFIRASFFFTAQIAINLSAPHLFEPFTPGILTLFALLTLTQPFLTQLFDKFQQRKSIVFWSSILLILSLVYLLSDYQGSSQWNDRVETTTILGWLSHAALTGTYPLFPWIIFAVFGSWIASQQSIEQTFPITNRSIFSIFCGLIFCAITLFYSEQNDLKWATPTGDAILTFFPSNAPFIIAALTGVALIWMLIQSISTAFLNPLGQFSLSVYLIHFIPIGLFHSLDETNDWSFTISMLVVLIYTVVWIPVAYYWHKVAPKISMENLLRKLSKKSLDSN